MNGMKNQIHIERDFGWFIGAFDGNQKHQHYAIQLTIPIEGELHLITAKETIITSSPVLIQSNVTHQIISNSRHFLLLINPASTIGHYWQSAAHKEIQEFHISPATQIIKVLNNTFLSEEKSAIINHIIHSHDCFCYTTIHQIDERINAAFEFLKANSHRMVSMEETADHCHLSPGRFLHLFKEETGITYRRAQLWTKVMQGLHLLKTRSFTEIAHSVGFADSAHFSRTFKENFGFSPREFAKISQFVQV
tara:strand:- start:160 stop:909 length:750 start_codon:yes stop_codon:yes gene_type:complete